MQTSLPKMTVVIDTNVWISGLVFGGNPEKVIRYFVDGRFFVITAEELLSELRRKISQRFPLFAPNQALLEASIREEAMLVQLGTVQIAVSRDVDDNKFIETATIGKADYIMSGDKDLLDVKQYKNIKIIKPAEFLQLLN
jgi:putative PIN family toxin of toxin-antitoxin system